MASDDRKPKVLRTSDDTDSDESIEWYILNNSKLTFINELFNGEIDHVLGLDDQHDFFHVEYVDWADRPVSGIISKFGDAVARGLLEFEYVYKDEPLFIVFFDSSSFEHPYCATLSSFTLYYSIMNSFGSLVCEPTEICIEWNEQESEFYCGNRKLELDKYI